MSASLVAALMTSGLLLTTFIAREFPGRCDVRVLFASILALMCVTYLLHDPSSSSADLLGRLWYIACTWMHVGLCSIAIQYGSWQRRSIICLGLISTLALWFTDSVVAGMQHVNGFWTRVPGEYYITWLGCILGATLCQLFSLVYRSFTGPCFKARNRAQWLLLSLGASEIIGLVLVWQMQFHNPEFNALSTLPYPVVFFCLGVYYSMAFPLQVPLNWLAHKRDNAKLLAYRAFMRSDSIKMSNCANCYLEQMDSRGRGEVFTTADGKSPLRLRGIQALAWNTTNAKLACQVIQEASGLPVAINLDSGEQFRALRKN